MFAVPANLAESEYEIKKSRFIARLVCVESRSQAMSELEKMKLAYPDAGHHCWAYLLGTSEANSHAAMSDDGEPSGTAGKPILNVIHHKKIGNIMLIVTRYFGGTKLGTGGLVRAYSAAAQQVIDQATLVKPVSMFHCLVTLDFAQEQALRHFIHQHFGSVDEVNYSDKVEIKVSLPSEYKQLLIDESLSRKWWVSIKKD